MSGRTRFDIRLPDGTRFNASSETNDPALYRARKAMVYDLLDREGGLAIVKARAEGLFSTRQLHEAYRQGRAALDALLATKRTPAVAPLVDEYIAGRASSVRDPAPQALRRYVASLPRGALVDEITALSVERFLGGLTTLRRHVALPASGATRNRYKAALGCFATWLVTHGHLPKHPFAGRAVRRIETARPRLPDMPVAEQALYLDAMLAEAGPVTHLATLVAVRTGADVGELIPTKDNGGQALRVLDLDLTRRQPRIRLKRHKVKRSPERYVPIPPDLADLLAAHVAGRPPTALVFPSIVDRTWATAHVRARKAIGRESLTRKDLRHIAAINWRRAGADLEQISKWLGHLTIQQTLCYTDFAPDDDFDAPVIARMQARLDGQPTPGIINIHRMPLHQNGIVDEPAEATA